MEASRLLRAALASRLSSYFHYPLQNPAAHGSGSGVGRIDPGSDSFLRPIAWNLVGLGSLGVGQPMVASCLGKCGGCPLACAGQCPAGLVRFRTLRFGRWRSHRRETHKRGRSRKAGLSPRTCEAMMLPPGSPVSSLRLGLASQRHLAFHATHARQARPSPVGAVRQMHTRDGGGGVEVYPSSPPTPAP